MSMILDLKTLILAIAAILGPVVAVVLTLIVQSVFQKNQRNWEFNRHEAQMRYIDGWNIANRDMFIRLAKAIEKLANREK